MIVTAAGMRDWKNKQQVFRELDQLLLVHLEHELPNTFVLRHGASGNVDNWADEWGRKNRVTIERFEAKWHGPDGTGGLDLSAGPVRNREMARALPKSDLWLTFWDGKFRLRGQRKVSGSFDGIVAALEAGINVSIRPPR